MIAGPPNCGKTRFACCATGLGFINPLVVSGDFNLCSYDSSTHDAVIFNDVNRIVDSVGQYRDLSQSRGNEVTVGGSQTNTRAYSVCLRRVPVVIVMNLDAEWTRLWSDSGSWLRGVAQILLIKPGEWAYEGAFLGGSTREEERAAQWEEASQHAPSTDQ